MRTIQNQSIVRSPFSIAAGVAAAEVESEADIFANEEPLKGWKGVQS